MKNNYKVIGMMSGTSLDGLDIAYCEFEEKNGQWNFSVTQSAVIRYPGALKEKLTTAHKSGSADFMALDAELGRFLGKNVKQFIEKNRVAPEFVASHGHTVFHQPQRGFTTQIGNGNAIHAATGLPVICDFRSLDVALGGQGAPLVPVGDKLLFAEHDICLNLGGIANLSADIKGERKAYDICFCNMTLNYLMASIGKEYDKGGEMSSSGEIDQPLLKDLGTLYRSIRKKRPSLGREMFENSVIPLLKKRKIPLEDKLATCTESTAIEIMSAAAGMNGKSMLCTGGGAFNSFLISRILEHAGDNVSIIIPDDAIIKFKEAVVFAFLGVLRTRGEVNCLSSVTGASRDNSGGVMIGF